MISTRIEQPQEESARSQSSNSTYSDSASVSQAGSVVNRKPVSPHPNEFDGLTEEQQPSALWVEVLSVGVLLVAIAITMGIALVAKPVYGTASVIQRWFRVRGAQ